MYSSNGVNAKRNGTQGVSREAEDWAQKNIHLKRKDPEFDPKLFSDVAQKAVELCKSKERNKPAQIRMFYDEIEAWQNKALASTDAEKKTEEILPYIRMIKAKLSYALGRKLIDQNFYQIFSVCIENIIDYESLKHAKLFFEAFIGFKKAQEAQDD